MKKTTYILLDCSGSIQDCAQHSRGSALNAAMKNVMENAIPQVLASGDADTEPYIAVLLFCGDKTEWLIPNAPMEAVGVSGWTDIEMSKFYGRTPTGAAIRAVVEDIEANREGGNGDGTDEEAAAPAILLISDGIPTDDYDAALEDAIKNCRGFRRANRIAIGIQVDNGGRESLKKFGRISSSLKEIAEPYYDCTDDNTQQLIEVIKTATIGLSTQA